MGQRYRVMSSDGNYNIIDHHKEGGRVSSQIIIIIADDANLAEKICYFMNEEHYEKNKNK